MTGRGIESKKLYVRFWNLFFSIPSDNLPAYSLKLPVKHNSVYSLISAFCHLWTALILSSLVSNIELVYIAPHLLIGPNCTFYSEVLGILERYHPR